MEFKKELLNDIGFEIRTSMNPQQDARALVADASEAKEKFEKALKKPLAQTPLEKTLPKKRVSFADPCLQTVKEKKEPIKSSSPQQRKLEVQRTAQPDLAPKQFKQKDQDERKQKSKVQKPKVSANKKDPIPKQQQQLPNPSVQAEKIQEPQSTESDQSQQIESNREQRQEQVCRHHNHHHQHRHRSSERLEKEQVPQRPQEMEQQLLLQVQELQMVIKRQQMNEEFLKSQLKLQEEEIQKHRKNMEKVYDERDKGEKDRQSQQQQLRDDYYQLKEQLQETNLKVIELRHSEGFLRKQNDTLQSHLDQISNKEQGLEDINIKLKQQVDQLKLKLLDKEGIGQRLEQQILHLTQDMDNYKTQAVQANQEVRNFINQVTKLENENVRYLSELREIKQSRGEYTDYNKDKLFTLENQLSQLQHEKQSFFQQLEITKQERDQWKQDCDVLKVNLVELEELRKRFKFKEIENEQLQHDNDKLKWKVRKDPNGVLSDLKNMPIYAQRNPGQSDAVREKQVLQDLQMLERENRQLQEANSRNESENRHLIQQLQKQREDQFEERKSNIERVVVKQQAASDRQDIKAQNIPPAPQNLKNPPQKVILRNKSPSDQKLSSNSSKPSQAESNKQRVHFKDPQSEPEPQEPYYRQSPYEMPPLSYQHYDMPAPYQHQGQHYGYPPNSGQHLQSHYQPEMFYH